MGVSFHASKDNETLVLTPSGIAFMKQEELKIYNGPGDDVYKGHKIDQLYFLYGVDQGTYEKKGWREANATKKYSSSSENTSGDRMDIGHDLKIIGLIGLGLFFVWTYEVILHPFYNFLFN
jgi:hypothetical protein